MSETTKPALCQAAVEKKLFKFQLLIGQEWIGDRQFSTVAELVRYANNYHQYSLNYNRVNYHIKRYGCYMFDRKCNQWQARILAVTPYPKLY